MPPELLGSQQVHSPKSAASCVVALIAAAVQRVPAGRLERCFLPVGEVGLLTWRGKCHDHVEVHPTSSRRSERGHVGGNSGAPVAAWAT